MRVSALITLQGRVVLARHRAGKRTYHLLPGGGVGYRETIEDALMREIREETGLTARLGPLLFVNDTIDPHGTRHLVNLTFRAEVTGGEITQRPDDPRVEAVDLVEPWHLAEIDLRPPMAAELLEALADDRNPCAYLGSIFTEEQA